MTPKMQARAPQSNSHGVRSRRLSEEVCSISGVEEIRIHSLHTSGLRRLFVAVVPSTQRPPDRARVCRRPAAVACRVAPVRRASEPFAANDSQSRLCVFGRPSFAPPGDSFQTCSCWRTTARSPSSTLRERAAAKVVRGDHAHPPACPHGGSSGYDASATASSRQFRSKPGSSHAPVESIIQKRAFTPPTPRECRGASQRWFCDPQNCSCGPRRHYFRCQARQSR
jgi:hypothetical protein